MQSKISKVQYAEQNRQRQKDTNQGQGMTRRQRTWQLLVEEDKEFPKKNS